MNPEVWVWLGIMVVLIVFELCTTSLTTIWFAGGAFVALIMALFNLPLWAEIVAFVVVSVVVLVFTRPLVDKVLKVGKAKTNVDSLIGMKAKVIVEINNSEDVGYVVVNGQEWSARSQNDEVIPDNSMVEIVEVTGVKLIVKGIN